MSFEGSKLIEKCEMVVWFVAKKIFPKANSEIWNVAQEAVV